MFAAQTLLLILLALLNAWLAHVNWLNGKRAALFSAAVAGFIVAVVLVIVSNELKGIARAQGACPILIFR